MKPRKVHSFFDKAARSKTSLSNSAFPLLITIYKTSTVKLMW